MQKCLNIALIHNRKAIILTIKPRVDVVPSLYVCKTAIEHALDKTACSFCNMIGTNCDFINRL